MVARVAGARRSEFERIVVCVIDDVQIWAVALDAGQIRMLHGQP